MDMMMIYPNTYEITDPDLEAALKDLQDARLEAGRRVPLPFGRGPEECRTGAVSPI